MKKLFSLLLCVVMVLSLVACGSKTDDAQTPDEPQDIAPELSGTMKVVATGDVYGPLFDAFTADTGVEVECLSMSSGEVLSKLRAEGGTPSADLWFGGGIDAFMSAKDDGLLEPVTFDAAAELGDEYKDTEGYWYSKGITIVGFLLNNSLMEELGLTAPESWDDLTDSQYAGEIVMSNPAVSGTNYAVVNALLQAKGDQGWDYCCLRTTHTTPDLADDVVLHSRTAEQFHSSLPLYSQTLTLNCCDSYWSLLLLNTPSVTFFTAPAPPTDTSMICSLSPPGTQRLKSSPLPDAQNHTIFTCQPRHTSL